MDAFSAYIDRFRRLDLTFFPAEDPEVIFSPETLQIFCTQPRGGRLLRNLRFAAELPEYARTHEADLLSVKPLVQKLVNTVAPLLPAAPDGVEEIAAGHVLPKLVLIVNNYCNLKCTYCYEHETMFRWPAHSMTTELAEFAIAKFYSTFGALGKLMFIGGEPTLNTAAIEAACARALAVAQEFNVAPPAFSMISNGFKLDDSTLKLLDKYQVQTTFSMDGPKKVNDLVRIAAAGIGSSDRVTANVKRYQSEVNATAGVECTVTRIHQDTGVTVKDLLIFLGDEFGVDAPHIAPAGVTASSTLYPYNGNAEKLVLEYRDAAAMSVNNVLRRVTGPKGAIYPSLDTVMSMMSTLIKRKGTNGMCPAGTTQLAVDCHGDIYPCWMFAGVADYRMGNVRSDDIFNDLSTAVLNKIAHNTKRDNPQCSKCFARYLCHACIGNNHNTTGLFDCMDEGFCNVVRATAETVIVKTAQLYKQPERWNQLRSYADNARYSKAETCP